MEKMDDLVYQTKQKIENIKDWIKREIELKEINKKFFNTQRKKKDFLKSLEDKKVSNVVFKAEGLGALEFDIVMTGKNFETTSIPFRIERISTDSFLKFLDLKSDIERAEKILLNFIAFPVEARDKEYFNLDMEAMTNISTLIVDFQQTPFLYIESFRETKAE